MGTSKANVSTLQRLKLDVPVSVVLILSGVVLANLSISMAQKFSFGAILFCALYVFWLARVSEKTFRYMLAVPAVVIMATVTIVPIVYLIWVSIHKVSILNFRGAWPFVGLKNYIDLIANDQLFIPCLIRSLELLVFGLVLQFLIGFGLALLCNREFRLRPVVTTILLLPIMTTSVVVGMLWKYMLNFYNGFVNLFLEKVGIGAQPWLTNQGLPFFKDLPYIGNWLVNELNFHYAFASIILTNTWQWTPMIFLLLMAGLYSLPQAPFEAAKVDGASAWQTLRYVTLPMLKPVIAVVLVIRGIDIMKTFGMIWALFGNAPITRTLNIHIYTIGLSTHNYGSSSSLSIITAGITVGLYLVYQRFFSEWE